MHIRKPFFPCHAYGYAVVGRVELPSQMKLYSTRLMKINRLTSSSSYDSTANSQVSAKCNAIVKKNYHVWYICVYDFYKYYKLRWVCRCCWCWLGRQSIIFFSFSYIFVWFVVPVRLFVVNLHGQTTVVHHFNLQHNMLWDDECVCVSIQLTNLHMP